MYFHPYGMPPFEIYEGMDIVFLIYVKICISMEISSFSSQKKTFWRKYAILVYSALLPKVSGQP